MPESLSTRPIPQTGVQTAASTTCVHPRAALVKTSLWQANNRAVLGKHMLLNQGSALMVSTGL